MQAVVLDKPGPPGTLHLAELDRPEPAEGEIRVRVQAVGLNPVDYKLADIGFPTWHYPFVLGLDAAGVIDAIGPGVHQWRQGDAVFYHGNYSRPGAFAEYAITVAHSATRMLPGLSFVDAAALPCAGFTAYQALSRRLRVQAGKSILVNGGAGGVGGFAVQLASLMNLRVIATCSAKNREFVKALGAEDVIDYNNENIAERVDKFTNSKGIDYVIETVSPESATESLRYLRFGGGIACIAGLPDLSKLPPFTKAPSIYELTLGGAYLAGDREAQEDLAVIGKELGALVAEGKVKAMVEETISLEAIPQGLTRLAARHVRGKIVARL